MGGPSSLFDTMVIRMIKTSALAPVSLERSCRTCLLSRERMRLVSATIFLLSVKIMAFSAGSEEE